MAWDDLHEPGGSQDKFKGGGPPRSPGGGPTLHRSDRRAVVRLVSGPGSWATAQGPARIPRRPGSRPAPTSRAAPAPEPTPMLVGAEVGQRARG